MARCGNLRVGVSEFPITVTFYEYDETLETDVIVDISSASVKQIILQDESGNSTTYDAEFYTDGTDGILSYTLLGTELTSSGTWRAQGYVDMVGFEGHSSIKKFKVEANL